MNPLQDMQSSGFFPHHGHTCNFVTVILAVTRVINYPASPVSQERDCILTSCDMMPPVGKTVVQRQSFTAQVKVVVLTEAQVLETDFRYCSCNVLGTIGLYKWETIRYRKEWKIVFPVRKKKHQFQNNFSNI